VIRIWKRKFQQQLLEIPGIVIIFSDRWASWHLVAGWKGCGRDIGWAKAVTLKLAILWLIQEDYLDCDVTIHGDKMSVIGAFCKGCSRNIPHNDSIHWMASSIIPNNIAITPAYIPSDSNRADLISHSILGLPSLYLQNPPQLPVELRKFLSYV